MTKPTTHTFCKDKKGRRCTVAIRLQEVGDIGYPNIFEVAVAVTSKSDNFSRKIGRDIVYGRLNAAENGRFGKTSWVIGDLKREQLLAFLTENFDISRGRATLMIDKDILRLSPPSTVFSRALERGTFVVSSIDDPLIFEEDRTQEIPF